MSDDGAVGVYTRLGRVPNQGGAVFTACVCGPGRPSVMLVRELPLPAGASVDVDGLAFQQAVEVPLERFRATAAGVAESHADPSAPLRGEAGAPVELAFDLVWETDGIPYQWRRATRYEIPCRVTGTVTVGGERIEFTGPGQRDHSWGPRDWFASDWMWNALHLSDGTHTHMVGVPDAPGFGVGYVQRDGELDEVTSLRLAVDVGPDGLPTHTRTVSEPGSLQIDLEPVAYGAVLLRAADGRTSHFPRAMCRVTMPDGRRGTGWAEWNRRCT